MPDGFEVELVAAPPLVDRPVSMDFDEQGRLYVTTSSGSNDKVQKQLEASRLLVYNAAEMVDRGEEQFGRYSAMAKMYASDRAMEVTSDAIQILGGYGYMKEYPAERMMRDAKITQIYEGTNQIQRLVIARDLLK